MRWIWIDNIIAFEPETRLEAIKNVTKAEDQLRDHFDADGDDPALPVMPASLMIEGMAQTAGILVGSARSFREKVILAKIVRAEFEQDVFPGQTIRYEAVLDRIDALGASTHGTVTRRSGPDQAWEPIGRVDLMFSHIDQNMSGLEFPEENFVFENDFFKSLIKSAGIEALSIP